MSKISGIQPDIRPDIRYPAPTGYPAGNPVSGFQNGRISGKTAVWSIPIINTTLISELLALLWATTMNIFPPSRQKKPISDSSTRTHDFFLGYYLAGFLEPDIRYHHC